MSNADLHERSQQHRGGFWKSRAGVVLIAFLSVAGFLLAYEHRAHILTGYGLLILFLFLCVGMHFFMHARHGDQGNHGGKSEGDVDPDRQGRR